MYNDSRMGNELSSMHCPCAWQYVLPNLDEGRPVWRLVKYNLVCGREITSTPITNRDVPELEAHGEFIIVRYRSWR